MPFRVGNGTFFLRLTAGAVFARGHARLLLEELLKVALRRKVEVSRNFRERLIGKAQKALGFDDLLAVDVLRNAHADLFLELARKVRPARLCELCEIVEPDLFRKVLLDIGDGAVDGGGCPYGGTAIP